MTEDKIFQHRYTDCKMVTAHSYRRYVNIQIHSHACIMLFQILFSFLIYREINGITQTH